MRRSQAIIGGLGILSLLLMGGFVHFYGLKMASFCRIELRSLKVRGRKRTAKLDILQATALKQRDPLWKVPLSKIKDHLEKTPWVRSAVVERRLPWSLIITVIEKEPLAIWQHQGQKQVIDDQGHPISYVDPSQFKDLILITGAEAPLHFPKLYEQLKTEPKMPKIKAASFLRSQRWDLYTEANQIIKLPDTGENPFQRIHQVWPLLKEARIIDLRFPDAILFEPHP